VFDKPLRRQDIETGGALKRRSASEIQKPATISDRELAVSFRNV